MKNTIIAQNKEHLRKLIYEEIQKHDKKCNLNHIDTSLVTDMSYLLSSSSFNGDISKWDTSNVLDMNSMFYHSKFNGDISKWNTSNVESMSHLFSKSPFEGDVTAWDVSQIKNMEDMFYGCKAPLPYWAKIDDFQERVIAIDAYHTKKLLEQSIDKKFKKTPIVKI